MMYSDANLRNEIISALLGQPIAKHDGTRGKKEDFLTVDDFHRSTICGTSAQTGPKVLFQNQAKCLTVDDFHRSTICGTGATGLKALFIDQAKFFDPLYDCDFTGLSSSDDCRRGGEPYRRPYGWYRIALKVKGKYPDGDVWLGPDGWRNDSAPGEWPACFHGTSLDGAKGIITSHYEVGDREKYGRGIYSTPDINIAEKFATTFESETTGKKYKVILQNRINPKERKLCSRKNYWLIPVPAGTTAEKEKEIVERSIRPYAILIKEMCSENTTQNNDGEDGADAEVSVLSGLFNWVLSFF